MYINRGSSRTVEAVPCLFVLLATSWTLNKNILRSFAKNILEKMRKVCYNIV